METTSSEHLQEESGSDPVSVSQRHFGLEDYRKMGVDEESAQAIVDAVSSLPPGDGVPSSDPRDDATAPDTPP